VYRSAYIYGADKISYPSALGSNYVFKKLQMQDFEFTPVNSPSANLTKDVYACENLQSLEIRFSALDWNTLLRYMVTVSFRILSECEFGRYVYVTAHSYYTASHATRE